MGIIANYLVCCCKNVEKNVCLMFLDRCDGSWQWRRLHRARGHVAPMLQMAGQSTGAPWVEEQQTRNWQNFTDHHESAHEND